MNIFSFKKIRIAKVVEYRVPRVRPPYLVRTVLQRLRDQPQTFLQILVSCNSTNPKIPQTCKVQWLELPVPPPEGIHH